MVVGYDAEGNVVNRADKRLPLKLNEQNYAAARKGGQQFAQEIAMPAS